MMKDLRIGTSALVAGVIAISGALSAHAADMSHRGMGSAGKKYVPAHSGGYPSKSGMTGSKPGMGMDHRPYGNNMSSGYPAASKAKTQTNWTGFYVGGQAGYGWAAFDWTAGEETTEPGKDELGTMDLTGLIFGGQAGYMVELDENIVVGVEGDLLMTKELTFNSVTKTSGAAAGDKKAFAFSVDPSWVATLRARVGSSMDNYMVYGTGGVAFGRISATYTDKAKKKSATVVQDRATGWALGGGLEVLLSDNLTTRLEYLFYNLGEDNYAFKTTDGATFDEGKGINGRFTMHSLRLGVNLKF